MRAEVYEDLGHADSPAAPAIDAAAIWAEADADRLGHADFHYTAAELAAFAHNDDEPRLLLVAFDGSESVGMLSARMPRSDNTHVISVEVRIRPGMRTELVLELLWEKCLELCRRENRTTVVWRENSRQENPTLTPATGVGGVEHTATIAWLREKGFVLDQVEVISTLEMGKVKVDGGVDKQGGYDVLTWRGPTPDHLLEGMARLRGCMATDAPHGSLEIEQEVWDANRIRREDAVSGSAGRDMLWAIALDPGGEPVGYTLIMCPEKQPDIAFQWDTLVRAEDRGQGLGVTLKAANLRQLRASHPTVARLHTWNAGENEWMLAINREIGFAPSSAEGNWVLKL